MTAPVPLGGRGGEFEPDAWRPPGIGEGKAGLDAVPAVKPRLALRSRPAARRTLGSEVCFPRSGRYPGRNSQTSGGVFLLGPGIGRRPTGCPRALCAISQQMTPRLPVRPSRRPPSKDRGTRGLRRARRAPSPKNPLDYNLYGVTTKKARRTSENKNQRASRISGGGNRWSSKRRCSNFDRSTSRSPAFAPCPT